MPVMAATGLWHNCQDSFCIKRSGVKKTGHKVAAATEKTADGSWEPRCKSLKEKWKSRGWWEGGQISRSRPGLSAGGRARGEITGLLPRRSLHRHTATDRTLLAPGRRNDSPQRCCCRHQRSPRPTYTDTSCLQQPQQVWNGPGPDPKVKSGPIEHSLESSQTNC